MSEKLEPVILKRATFPLIGTTSQRGDYSMSAIDTTKKEPLFYRVKQTAEYLGLSQRKLYLLLDDKDLKIEQKRIGGHLMNKPTGAVPRSMRLITAKGLQQLIDLINEEKI